MKQRMQHPSSPPVFSEVRVTRSLVLCVCLVIVVCPFVLFLSAIVLSVLFQYTDFDYQQRLTKMKQRMHKYVPEYLCNLFTSFM
jgi:hypothetical protein